MTTPAERKPADATRLGGVIKKGVCWRLTGRGWGILALLVLEVTMESRVGDGGVNWIIDGTEAASWRIYLVLEGLIQAFRVYSLTTWWLVSSGNFDFLDSFNVLILIVLWFFEAVELPISRTAVNSPFCDHHVRVN